MSIQVVDFKEGPVRTIKGRLTDSVGRVIEGNPSFESNYIFESSDNELTVGTWTSTPGKWIAFTGKDEFCMIISGHCRLISENGIEKDFKSGDAFFIPNGFRGYWEVVETTIKHFVIRNHGTGNIVQKNNVYPVP